MSSCSSVILGGARLLKDLMTEPERLVVSYLTVFGSLTPPGMPDEQELILTDHPGQNPRRFRFPGRICLVTFFASQRTFPVLP
jgi:hypothetical protein